MHETILYLDCFSGASGDMFLGALLDAGLDFEQLKSDLAQLGLKEYELRCQRQTRKGLTGTKFDVIDRGSDRPARNLQSVREILSNADIPGSVTARSLAIFERLAQAEAQVHGSTIDEIHFHEVGAVDSLIDIVGFCWALERLEIARIYASPVPTGSGTVTTEHGLLPLPAPATLALLSSVHAPLVPSRAESELVTPTGAALLAGLASFERPPIRVKRIGYGFGTRELPWANVLRAWIGEAVEKAPQPHHHTHTHPHSHPHLHPHEEAEAEHHEHDHDHTHPHHHADKEGNVENDKEQGDV